ncbi:MAG: hypothetical protein GY859_03870, partial [Desulfobacterales bacterium]|nr:hypothetical protein [Desulfobacterales bacterium]
SQELLIKKTKKSGGVFHVSSIPAPEARRAKPSQPPPETAAPGPSPEPSSPERSPGPAPAETAPARKATDGTSAAGKAGAGKAGARKATDGTPAAGKAGAGKVGAGKVGAGKVGAGAPNPSASAPMDLPRVLTALEEFVAIFESVVQTQKRLKGKFSPLLKKKFVDKADRYPFLDPFAAEFEYVNRKISFVGDAGEKELADGVFESVKELAEDLGLQAPFQETLAPWIKKHSRDFSGIGVTV